MPHINRIRLVDVAFNDAKSFYDDFMLIFNGKSATYDLENGGGKSVLLMMMLQVVLPNASLREDKPLRNIFLGGRDRTSHVLVEWVLDEGSPYKYLLTGFCARKNRSNKEDNNGRSSTSDNDIELSASGVEYFNYFHLYNAPNEYDIKNLQLCTRDNDKKKIMSFDQLKDMIKQMNKRGYAVDYFDRRGEYINFVKMYNLIDTEWKIIKEINSGENSIEKYFRQNKTSRKLIENLLIKIIEDSESQEFSKTLGDNIKENNLADTLIEIRENLNKFLKDKQHLHEYAQILEFYNKIKGIDESLKRDFITLEELKAKVVMNLNKIVSVIDNLKSKKLTLEQNIDKTVESLTSAQVEKECLDIQLLDFQKACLTAEMDIEQKKHALLEQERDGYQHEYNLCNAQNDYLKYKDELHRLNIAKNTLDNMGKDTDEIYKDYRVIGFNYKVALQRLIEKCQQETSGYVVKREEVENQKQNMQQQIDKINEHLGSLKNRIEDLKSKKSKYKAKLDEVVDSFRQQGRIDIIISPADWCEKINENIEETRSLEQDLIHEKTALNDAVVSDANTLVKLQGEVDLIDEKLKAPVGFMEEYGKQKARIDKLYRLYDVEGTPEDLKVKLTELSSGLKNAELNCKMEYNSIDKKLDIFNRYDFYVPNEEVVLLKEKLKAKYSNVFLGIELLQNEDEENKKALLNISRLLPYAVVMDHDGFNKLKENTGGLEDRITDYPVPVIDVESIRSKQLSDNKHILFWSGKNDIFINHDALNQFKVRLKQKSEAIQNELNSIVEKLHEIQGDRNELIGFKAKFTDEHVHQKMKEIDSLKNHKKALAEQISQLKKITVQNKEKIQKTELRIQKTQQQLMQLNDMAKQVSMLMGLNKEAAEVEDNLQQATKDMKQKENERQKFQDEKAKLERKVRSVDESIGDLRLKVKEHNNDLQKVLSFGDGDSLDLGYDELKSRFEAMHEMVKNQDIEGERLRKEISDHQKYMKDYENRIIQYGFEVAVFKGKEEQGQLLSAFSNEYISSLKHKEADLSKQMKIVYEGVTRLNNNISELNGTINEKKQKLIDNNGRQYIPVENLTSEHQIKEAIEDAKLMVKLFEEEKKKYEKQLKDVQGRIEELVMEQRDLVNFINNHKIDIRCSEALNEIVPYAEISKSYGTLEESINDKRRGWDKAVRIITAQVQSFYISEPIKALEELEAPTSLVEAETAVNQLDESIHIINEQMQKIQDDIEVLQSYQEEFNRQCIQRAEWILEKLKKFPSLSRIELNGAAKNMIEARFFDYSEEEKNERMKNHIRNIIKEINEDVEVDRSKIASRLSSKELLSRVTDMDKAFIRLYKVESIEEHSGYKRWEHAVGSEGQSNALYFIFAVCLVSYIRMLSLQNTSMKSKKVIIVDNPFGATSAVYLWEPMFNILKENDVQLIAPGHRISKELTSKFEVNYLLNQEILADNRVKVVVKDVRTEEDLEQMNFDVLEQISLL